MADRRRCILTDTGRRPSGRARSADRSSSPQDSNRRRRCRRYTRSQVDNRQIRRTCTFPFSCPAFRRRPELERCFSLTRSKCFQHLHRALLALSSREIHKPSQLEDSYHRGIWRRTSNHQDNCPPPLLHCSRPASAHTRLGTSRSLERRQNHLQKGSLNDISVYSAGKIRRSASINLFYDIPFAGHSARSSAHSPPLMVSDG